MQKVQRKFGTLLKRSADENDVGVILQEFDSIEKTLGRLADAGKLWADAWGEILVTQLAAAECFHVLYEPIESGEEDAGQQLRPTPKRYLDKASDLRSAYAEFRADLIREVNMIDAKLVKPAADAKEHLRPLKKVIKKREDSKLDYERYYSRVESAKKKESRSPKEEAALAKHESDLSRAAADYHAADANIKRVLPPIMNAVLSLVPYLLAIQIELQYTLVAQLYTTLHGYCQQHGLPSPAPPMEVVVSTFENEFTPLRHELESSINLIANGKVVHQPMTVVDKKQGSVTGLGLRNTFAQRRASSQSSASKPGGSSQIMDDAAVVEGAEDEEEAPPIKPPRPSSNAMSPLGQGQIPSNRPSSVGMSLPLGSPQGHGSSSASTPFLTPMGSGYGPSRASPGTDYFSHERKPSVSSIASSIAAKKKPPPPVPAKRLPSAQSQFVTALFPFAGQNAGDLSFGEGDHIKVLKKTDSTDDWWEGEIRGMTGSFPANYVKVG